jgi:hypothetical protein
MKLFREGFDTMQIAKMIGKSEAYIVHLIDSARYYEKLKIS